MNLKGWKEGSSTKCKNPGHCMVGSLALSTPENRLRITGFAEEYAPLKKHRSKRRAYLQGQILKVASIPKKLSSYLPNKFAILIVHI
jgi:hypothetical protein